MSKRFILNFIIFYCFAVFGSCTNELDTHANITSLLNIALADETNPNELIRIGKKGLSLSKDSDYQKGIGDSYHLIGVGYDLAGKYDLSIKHHLAAMEVREDISDNNGMANSYYNLARIHILAGLYQEATAYYLKALPIWEQTDQKNDLAKVYRGLGLAYQELKDWQRSQSYYEKALRIRQLQNDKAKIGWLYNDLAVINELKSEDRTVSNSVNYKLILDFYNKSLLVNQQLQEKQPLAWSHLNVGRTYINLKQHDIALKHLQSAEEILLSLKDTSNLISTYNSQAEAFLLKGNTEQALQSLHSAKKFSEAAVGGNHNKQVDLLDTYNIYLKLYIQEKNEAKIKQYENKIQQAKLVHYQLLDRIKDEQRNNQNKITSQLRIFSEHLVQVSKYKYTVAKLLALGMLVILCIVIKMYADIKKTLQNYKAFTALLLRV